MATEPQRADAYQVGDLVTVRFPIIEECTDCHPQQLLAEPGERLIVRELIERRAFKGFAVSHEGRTDGMTFTVTADEIARLP
jgi:hypothetical protein